MVKPVTLSSQNRTIQSNIRHYLKKSHCQKKNNLHDVMGVSDSKEHASLHGLWFTNHTAVSSYFLLPPNSSFFQTPTSKASHITLYPSQSTVPNMEAAAQATKQSEGLGPFMPGQDGHPDRVVVCVCICSPQAPPVVKDDLTKTWGSKQGSKSIFSAGEHRQLTDLRGQYGLEKGLYTLSRDGYLPQQYTGELTQPGSYAAIT